MSRKFDNLYDEVGNEYLLSIRKQHRTGAGEHAPSVQVLSRFEAATPRKAGPSSMGVDRVQEFIDILRNRT